MERRRCRGRRRMRTLGLTSMLTLQTDEVEVEGEKGFGCHVWQQSRAGGRRRRVRRRRNEM